MLLSSLEPCNDSANLDLQDKMHTFSLVTGCLWLRLCLSVQFITHCTPPWPPRLEPHGPAYSCSKAPVRGAALCSSCFLPQDAFPIQSVWQMHLPSFNLKDASSVKPFQTASHPHSLENQLLPLLGFAVTWPMCSSLICHHGWGHGQDLIPLRALLLHGYYYYGRFGLTHSRRLERVFLTVSVVWVRMMGVKLMSLSVKKSALMADWCSWAVAWAGEQWGPQSLGCGFPGTTESSGKVRRAGRCPLSSKFLKFPKGSCVTRASLWCGGKYQMVTRAGPRLWCGSPVPPCGLSQFLPFGVKVHPSDPFSGFSFGTCSQAISAPRRWWSEARLAPELAALSSPLLPPGSNILYFTMEQLLAPPLGTLGNVCQGRCKQHFHFLRTKAVEEAHGEELIWSNHLSLSCWELGLGERGGLLSLFSFLPSPAWGLTSDTIEGDQQVEGCPDPT